MNSLFQTYTLNNGVEIKNRLVVAPMTHFSSNEDGTLSEQERTFISNRAVDMGMFITAATLVAKNGKTFVGQPEALDDSHLDSLREIAQVLQAQGAKAILQIHHGGVNAQTNLTGGLALISASDHAESGAKAATADEVVALIEAYANAAELGIRAGFDGVEIHGANGYLIQQFFSGQFNRRTDEWGGSLEKRLRFPLAIVDAVVALKEKYAKPEFIVGYRFSPEEPGENGLTMTDTFALIDALVEKPLQYLHVSLHEFDKKARRGADTHLTRMQLIHERINGKLPLIGLGALLSGKQIRAAFQTGWAEFIGLGKAVMVTPNIATLLKENRDSEITTELDPTRADQYGIPDFLWSLCQQGGAWLPPVKGHDWKPVDI
ncbi:NADH-dependent flavin oxidoreductase [Ursidibacter maritimus]|uniref:NADH-dependent flavin oxidoreductase n=1 Tax=Ursidibacter maritimus TaxID=1331689 RepID=A0A949T6T2_9PAST|nr:NADH-dependent flavin oxidoreductase [Ursidibacter maritimus]KAE9540207.1 NADH-dependent flavin oxidoreductase [Ursidibacter maritimus]MBV6524352.1 NADH-dependent flavin oxidoreductase [Ursidibacter maritimus]MBV6526368.1 NADH-dependent flavin oxidoreductase [Ursidibacter maritimus]MBV6527901.1 NADH-dependent flavin oxidoreductase [Ursidibacter maritimus]MBV6529146.1 NADH-dependent flavin oxidoreductase [Ursidibacter maritimus]